MNFPELIFDPEMSQNTSLDKSVIKIFRNKRYFVIMQGCRGSAKTTFCHEFKKYYPIVDFCSLDDYYTEQNIPYDDSEIKRSYEHCKQKLKHLMTTNHSILYNNTNLNENHLDDLIQEAKKNEMFPIILRFMPRFDKNDNESMCTKFTHHHHPLTQQHCNKQSIIEDNKKMLQYENKNHLNTFGIKVTYHQSTNSFYFSQSSPNLTQLKNDYIEKGWVVPKIIYPKQPKQSKNNNQVPHMLLPPTYSQMQNSEKKDLLQQKMLDLEREMNALILDENPQHSQYSHHPEHKQRSRQNVLGFKTLRTEDIYIADDADIDEDTCVMEGVRDYIN